MVKFLFLCLFNFQILLQPKTKLTSNNNYVLLILLELEYIKTIIILEILK